MTEGKIMSPTTTGRLVGAGFLLAFVVYGGGGALVDAGAGTPAVLGDVVANQTQIAAGALVMLVNSVIVIAIGVLMLPILQPDHERTAYVYLAARVVEGVLLAVGVLLLLFLIPLGDAYEVVDGDGSVLPSLAEVAQTGNLYARHIAMIGLGIGGFFFCRALDQASLVPRSLCALGMVGYPVLTAGESLDLLGYGIGMVHFAPGGVFEVVLGVLLIVRGFPERHVAPEIDAPAAGSHREALDVR